jgi:hypothetical protein
MPTFQPPTIDAVPSVLPPGTLGQSATAYLLMRHYGLNPRGRTVLKIAGTYGTYDCPDANVVASATEVYQGGHEYVITTAQAAALTAAGYGANIT